MNNFWMMHVWCFFHECYAFPIYISNLQSQKCLNQRDMYSFYQQDMLIICLKQGMYEITDMYINFIT
jgi:hypothetical protein